MASACRVCNSLLRVEETFLAAFRNTDTDGTEHQHDEDLNLRLESTIEYEKILAWQIQHRRVCPLRPHHYDDERDDGDGQRDEDWAARSEASLLACDEDERLSSDEDEDGEGGRQCRAPDTVGPTSTGVQNLGRRRVLQLQTHCGVPTRSSVPFDQLERSKVSDWVQPLTMDAERTPSPTPSESRGGQEEEEVEEGRDVEVERAGEGEDKEDRGCEEGKAEERAGKGAEGPGSDAGGSNMGLVAQEHVAQQRGGGEQRDVGKDLSDSGESQRSLPEEIPAALQSLFPGDVYAFGCTKYGKLGIDPRRGSAQPPPHAVQLVGKGAPSPPHVDGSTPEVRQWWPGNDFMKEHVNDGPNNIRRKSVWRAEVVREISNRIVVAVFCGDHHSFALMETGVLFGWGCNKYGQIGVDHCCPVVWPQAIHPLIENSRRIVDVCAGPNFSIFVDSDNVVYACGKGSDGQLGRNVGMSPVPVVVEWCQNGVTPPSPIVQICCGEGHVQVLLKDGSVFGWGSNQFGQLGIGGNGRPVVRPSRVKFPRPTTVKHIACGSNFSVSCTRSGDLYVSGNAFWKSHTRFSPNAAELTLRLPVKLFGLGSSNPVQCIAAAPSSLLVVLLTGAVLRWSQAASEGAPTEVVPGSKERVLPRYIHRPFEEGRIVRVATSPCWDGHLAVVLSNGQLRVWGNNQHSQTGFPPSVDRVTEPTVPASMPPGIRAADVDVGLRHTLVLTDTDSSLADDFSSLMPVDPLRVKLRPRDTEYPSPDIAFKTSDGDVLPTYKVFLVHRCRCLFRKVQQMPPAVDQSPQVPTLHLPTFSTKVVQAFLGGVIMNRLPPCLCHIATQVHALSTLAGFTALARACKISIEAVRPADEPCHIRLPARQLRDAMRQMLGDCMAPTADVHIEVVAEGGTAKPMVLKAHSCVLTRRCPTLRRMIVLAASRTRDSGPLTIQLRGVEVKVLKLAMEVLYTDDLRPVASSDEPDNLLKLMKLAQSWDMPRLHGVADNVLRKLVHLENVATLHRSLINSRVSAPHLREHYENFARVYRKHVSRTKGYKSLSNRQKGSLLDSVRTFKGAEE